MALQPLRRGCFFKGRSGPRMGVLIWALFLSLLPGLLSAAEPLTGLSNRIWRNDQTVGGSTATSTSHNVFLDLNESDSSEIQSASYNLFPGLGNLIVHPNSITDLAGVEVSSGSVSLVWTAPPVMDGFVSSTGAYLVRYSTKGPLNSETAFEAATVNNVNWTPLAPGSQETVRLVTGLPLGTTVYIGIKAQDTAGNRAYVSSGTATLAGVFVSSPVAAPSSFAGIPYSSTSIDWQWVDNADNESGYRVLAASGGAISPDLPPGTTFFVQQSLSGPNTGFVALVQAFNNVFVSSAGPINVFTLANPALSLDIDALSSTTIAAHWDRNFNPSTATSYKLEVSTSAADYIPVAGSSATVLTTATVGGLTPNTSYFYRTTAFNGDSVASTPTASVSTVTLAAQPTFMSFSPGQTTLGVGWNTSGNPSPDTVYEVQITTSAGFGDPGVTVSSTTTFNGVQFSGLTPSTTYYVRARAINRMGIPTAFADFGSDMTAPNAPGLVGFSVYTTSITVTLAPNFNPPGTVIEISTGLFSASDSSVGVQGAGNTDLTIFGLTPNTPYNLQAQAVNGLNTTSSMTFVASTATYAAVPGPVAFTQVNLSSFTAQWSNNGNPVANPSFLITGTSYQVQLSTDSGFGVSSASDTLVLSVTTTTLEPNTSYYMRVAAYNVGGGQSAYGATVSTATLAAVPVSIVPTYTTVSPNLIAAQWSPSNNPADTRYVVDISTWNGFSGTVTSSSTFLTSVSTSGLASLTSYYFRVKAVNRFGLETAYLDLGSTETTSAGGSLNVSSPTNVRFTWVALASATVTWDLNSGNSYLMALALDPGFTTVVSSGVGALNQNTTNFFNLSPDTSYYFRVKVSTDPDLAYCVAVATVSPPRSPGIVSYVVNRSSIVVTLAPNGNPAATVVSVTTGAFGTAESSSGVQGSGNVSLVLDNLQPYAFYTISARALNFADAASSVTVVATTRTLTNGVIVSGFAVYTTSATVFLGANGNPIGKQIVFSTGAAGDYAVALSSIGKISGPVTPLTLFGLSTNTAYALQAGSLEVDNTTTPAVVTASTATLAATPGAPAIVSAAISSITLTLQDPALAGNPSYTEFAIFNVTAGQWLQNPSGGASALGASPQWNTYSVWGGTNGVSNTGLVADTSYSFRVQARNLNGTLTALGPVSASTTTTVGPPVVTGSLPSTGTWVDYTTSAFTLSGSVIFRYRYNTLPADLATDFDPIQYASHSLVLIATVTAEGTNYIHVRGENSQGSFAGNADYGPIWVDTTAPTGLPPLGLAVDTFSMTVNGGTASDALSGLQALPYRFSETTGNSGSMGQASWDTLTSTSDSGLAPNTSYTFVMEARDVAGNIASVSATTATLAAIPGAISPTGIFISSITVSWTNPYNNPSDTRYRVQFSTDPGFDIASSSEVTQPGFSIVSTTQTLLGNTSYFFRVQALNRYDVETTWVYLGSTLTTLSNSVDPLSISSGVAITSASFSWAYPANPSNPADTLYVLEVSSDNFATVQRTSTTILNQALVTRLLPDTDYKVRIAALNRLGIRTEAAGTRDFHTLKIPPLCYIVGLSSITVTWNPDVAPPGSEFQISASTYLISGFTPYVSEAWTAGISSWTFVDLSTNTRYGYQLYYREGVGLDTFYTTGDTRTLAAVPDAPTVNTGVPGIARITINPGVNPLADPNNTEFAVYAVAPNTPHDQKYVPAPGAGLASDMSGSASTPTWLTYSQWGGASGFSVNNLYGFTVYTFSVKARNGYGVETDLGSSASVLIPPGSPRIIWETGLPESSWVNTMITSFTALNSAHYHYRFNQNINDTVNVSTTDTPFDNGQIVTATATAEGAWYFHVLGDLYGFNGETQHVPLVPNQRFVVNVDTTPPNIITLAAQFSPTDNTPIQDGVVTTYKSPYFYWSSPISNALIESPILGYSVIFATGADPGDSAVPGVVTTTSPGVQFTVTQSSDRPTGTYYFRVKAQDTAGNWGPSRLFVYKALTDNTLPHAVIEPQSPVQAPDGRHVCVKSSTTIDVQFDKDMKTNVVTSSANVQVVGIRDNMANAQNFPVSVNLSYDGTNHVLHVSPVSELPKGWLYEVTVTTDDTDLAGNPLQSQAKIYFETLMDHTAQNRAVGSDTGTVVDIPANSLPEDFSLLVGVISGGVPAGAPSVYQSLQFASQQALSAANDKMSRLIGPFAQPVAIREFSALDSNGRLIETHFTNNVSVTIPYLDSDGDGFVDGTSPRVRVKKLAVYVLDEDHGLWNRIPNGSVDSSARTTSANVPHFSVYSLFGVPDTDVSQSYAYPVPFRPSQGHREIIFAQLPSEGSIRVYTVSGELVKKMDFLDPTSGMVHWDVTNSGGEPVGSDVYVYVVQSGDNKKVGKLVVIR